MVVQGFTLYSLSVTGTSTEKHLQSVKDKLVKFKHNTIHYNHVIENKQLD